MSYADQVFISMCEDILENGTSTEGEKVRPHWPDGESAYTIKQFGVVSVFEFPPLLPQPAKSVAANVIATNNLAFFIMLPPSFPLLIKKFSPASYQSRIYAYHFHRVPDNGVNGVIYCNSILFFHCRNTPHSRKICTNNTDSMVQEF